MIMVGLVAIMGVDKSLRKVRMSVCMDILDILDSYNDINRLQDEKMGKSTYTCGKILSFAGAPDT